MSSDRHQDRAADAASVLRAITEQLVLTNQHSAAQIEGRLDAVINHLEAARNLLADADLQPWHRRDDHVQPAQSFAAVSPVRGTRNAVAPPLSLEPGSGSLPLVGAATFNHAYEGPAGCVHGGWLAAVFDGLLGHAVSRLGPGRSGLTGRLTVRYRHPAPLHTSLRFDADVTRDRGRMVMATATCSDPARPSMVFAEAEAMFVRPRLNLP